MMHGPACSTRHPAQHGRVEPAEVGAEIGGAHAQSRGSFLAEQAFRIRQPRRSRRLRRNQLHAHELDRLVGAGLMTVGPFVLATEGLLQCLAPAGAIGPSGTATVSS